MRIPRAGCCAGSPCTVRSMKTLTIFVMGLALLAYTGCGSELQPPEEHDKLVFDLDYDDSWVANVPEAIGGYRVLYVHTPKSMACTSLPVIGLQTPPDPDSGDITVAIAWTKSIPGGARLGVGPAPIDAEEMAAYVQKWNEDAERTDCFSGFGSGLVPDLPDDP